MNALDFSDASLPRLAASAQLGDRSALELLLRRLADQLRPHIEHLTGDADRADDVLQEVLLRVAVKLPALREHSWVRAWAYRIATREALRQVAGERRVVFTTLDAVVGVSAGESVEDAPFDSDVLMQLPLAVAGLPAASQVVVRLHYLHGLTQPEIAEVLSIPIGTVKSRLSYGLRLLRAQIVTIKDFNGA